VQGFTIRIELLGSGVRIPVGAKYSFPENRHTGFGAQPASCKMGTVFLSRRYSGQGVKLTTHLHPVPRLGMSGAVGLLPPCDLRREEGKLPFSI
jgi:hypothetical protein